MLRALRDAVGAVGAVVVQSAISGAVALFTAFIYSQGLLWTGRSPSHQTRVEFLAANMVHLNVFLVVVEALGYSIPLARHRSTKWPNRAPSLLFWFARLLQATSKHWVVATALIVPICVTSTKLSESWKPYLVHFYASSLPIQYCMVVLDVTSRDLYRTETAAGLATRPNSKRLPKWKRIIVTAVRNLGFLATVYAASAYIQLSNRLRLENQETFIIFSVASMTLRFLIMKALMWVVGRRGTIHVRLLYVLTAVPTVMIGTQVRVALLRVKGTISTTSVIVLALIEPFMRIFKVWGVRRAVGQNLVPPTRKVASIAPTPVPSDLNPKLQLIPTRASSRGRPSHVDSTMHTQLLLQFAAAEIHADMCSEYIAIACSLAIFYCLEGHPQYTWPVQASEATLSVSRVELVLLQLAIEFVVDTTCCLWELINGIPLRTGSELHRFLLGLFTGCAVTNVGVCCSIYIK